jgi:PST family polysaccharide transporter
MYGRHRWTPFDAKGEFRAAPSDESLRRLTVQGAGVSLLSQALGLAVQMIATVVLARLLTPSDFGVVTMVTTFSLLFANFGLNGFTEGVVQREEMNSALASNLFWINLAAGLLLTITFAASGSLLAAFFHNPLVAHVAIGFSLTIVLASLSVLHLALLKRAMLFTPISANSLFSRAVFVIVSIALGFAGWSYWALVAGAIAQALTTAIGAWVLCRWVPQAPRKVDGTGSMVRFAMNVYWFYVLNYIKGNMDNLLVGWYFGTAALGLYKRAFDLFFLPANQLLDPMAAATVPALCRMTDDPERYRRYLLRSFSILAFVGMGVGAYLCLAGKDLILVMLGPKWDEAGRIFRLFAPGVGAMFLSAPWAWIPLSIGRADRFARWGLVQLIVTGALFFAALPWGPRGIAVAWSASFWILALPATWYAGKPIRFGVAPVIAVIWKYVVASMLAAGAGAFIIGQFPSLDTIPGALGGVIRIAVTFSVFGTLYLAVAVLLHGGWEPLRQITRLLPDLAPLDRREALAAYD